jgi:uncharacterized glyoxalase superfamily protein PhnB
MINGAHFLLYSQDPSADQAALQEILASRSVPTMGGRRILALPPAEIATHLDEGTFEQRHAGHDLRGIILYLVCDDLPQTIAALKEKGIDCTGSEDTEFGLKTTILLPGGGKLGLYQPSHELAFAPDNAEQWPRQSPGLSNRSMPDSVVIPVLAYPDVRQAVDWLGNAFGFVERLRIGDHRAQLSFGDGSVIVTGQQPVQGDPATGDSGYHSIMVRVADVDSHYQRVEQFGAQIVNPPADYPYGERQYTVKDPGGHYWTFSQTIADVDPESWGGQLINQNES